MKKIKDHRLEDGSIRTGTKQQWEMSVYNFVVTENDLSNIQKETIKKVHIKKITKFVSIN